nr:MAG TPA: hypothetical protein [Bacteriophage sp.]
MERLTMKTEDGYERVSIRTKNQQLIDKLAYYEDLEEQGRLLKLPCDKVYYIVDKNNPKYAAVMSKAIRDLTVYEIEDIDKSGCKYFSTKEKTEARLRELRGEEDER